MAHTEIYGEIIGEPKDYLVINGHKYVLRETDVGWNRVCPTCAIVDRCRETYIDSNGPCCIFYGMFNQHFVKLEENTTPGV